MHQFIFVVQYSNATELENTIDVIRYTRYFILPLLENYD